MSANHQLKVNTVLLALQRRAQNTHSPSSQLARDFLFVALWGLLPQQLQSWSDLGQILFSTERLWSQSAARHNCNILNSQGDCVAHWFWSYFQTNFMRKVLLSQSYYVLWHLLSIFHKNEQDLNTMHTLSTAGYPSAQMAPAVSQQPYPGTYAIIQPSVVVVGGCPACRWGDNSSSVVLAAKAFIFGNLACQ